MLPSSSVAPFPSVWHHLSSPKCAHFLGLLRMPCATDSSSVGCPPGSGEDGHPVRAERGRQRQRQGAVGRAVAAAKDSFIHSRRNHLLKVLYTRDRCAIQKTAVGQSPKVDDADDDTTAGQFLLLIKGPSTKIWSFWIRPWSIEIKCGIWGIITWQS